MEVRLHAKVGTSFSGRITRPKKGRSRWNGGREQPGDNDPPGGGGGGRATLRQVCRSWNQFLESTASTFRAHSTQIELSAFLLSAIVKRLSMTITTRECFGLAINWASDLFQMVHAAILSYSVTVEAPHRDYFTDNPRDFLAPVTAKIALRRFHIASNGCGRISFSHLSAKFRGLVSLSLSASVMRSAEELTLPGLLEHLHITECPESPPLPTQWDLPRLRHVYIAVIRSTTDFNTVLNFSRRYASQLESLFLVEYPSQSDIPHDFWESFTSLQMFGVRYHELNHCSWNGWDITPPRTRFGISHYLIAKILKRSSTH